jgi:hypothetical protein
MKKLILATVAAAGLLSGCATDAGLIDRPLISGTEAGLFDTDGDGLFERAEYDAFGDDNFEVWDTNDDNWIDENEFGAGFDEAGWDDDEGAFDTFDDDTNSYLDDDEFFDDEDFADWDVDADGILDDDEWGV